MAVRGVGAAGGPGRGHRAGDGPGRSGPPELPTGCTLSARPRLLSAHRAAPSTPCPRAVPPTSQRDPHLEGQFHLDGERSRCAVRPPGPCTTLGRREGRSRGPLDEDTEDRSGHRAPTGREAVTDNSAQTTVHRRPRPGSAHGRPLAVPRPGGMAKYRCHREVAVKQSSEEKGASGPRASFLNPSTTRRRGAGPGRGGGGA